MKIKSLLRNMAGGLVVASALFALGGCNLMNHDNHSAGHDPYDSGHCYSSSGHAGDSRSVIDTELYRLEKMAPSIVALGETMEYHYTLKPKKHFMHMSLIDKVPTGATLDSTMPEARIEGDEMVWDFEDVHAGDVIEVAVAMRATEMKSFGSCARVEAVPFACTWTHVGQPMLSICKEGPTEILQVGDQACFSIVVENNGNYPAYDVVIRDIVPNGLEHHTGSKNLVMNVGTLDPGHHVHERVSMVAVERGQFCNVAEVSSSNAGTMQDTACVNVVVPGISIMKEGPAERFLDEQATYTIVVTNTGDTVLHHVEVTDHLPCHYRVASATDGAYQHGEFLTWEETDMAPGESHTYEITVCNNMIGEFCNEAFVTADCLATLKDEVCTMWKGYPAILLEVVDTEDPLRIGDETCYKIRVTNQGTALDRDISILAKAPAEMVPVSASGPTQYRINGQNVKFESVPVLHPGQSVQFNVVGRAVKVGDARFKVELTSELLKSSPPASVNEEESTHIN